MENIGNSGMVFGDSMELFRLHPNDKLFVAEGATNRGVIGDAVVLRNGVQCISIFVGCGESVVISAEGKILGRDDLGKEDYLSRIKDGAWIPVDMYHAAMTDEAATH